MSDATPIDDGGPAFPVPSVGTGDPRDGMTQGSDGMSLRDWLAAHETLADFDDAECSISDQLCVGLAGRGPSGDWRTNTIEWVKWEAKWRSALKYIRADAMLAAREKGAK